MSKLQLSGLLVVLLLVSGCTRKTPEEVSQHYWEAVIANDEQAVQQLIVKSSSPGLSRMIQPGPESRVSFGPTERTSFSNPEEEGGTAEVPTTIHWVDEDKTSTFETETILAFEDGTWKVDPERTREAFFDSVYRSALTGLEAALEQSARAFRDLGSELSNTMARELSEASRELQDQSEQANQEIQEFLESLDQELQKELEKRN